MIPRALFGLLLLFLLALIENAFVSALPQPLVYVPLVFIAGILLFHLVRPNFGVAWLLTGGALLDLIALPGPSKFIVYALTAAVGLFLARKVFTNRSVYAMMGMGISMYGLSLIIESIWDEVLAVIAGHPLLFADLFHLFWIRLGVFTVALYVIYFITRRFLHLFQQRFFLRT